MAPYSSTLAWKIPWTEEPGRLQSMRSLRVGHDWATSLSLFTSHFHALEKEMATHSSVLAWRIPGTGEPGELPSMGSHRVWHDWSDLAAATGWWHQCSEQAFVFVKWWNHLPTLNYLPYMRTYTYTRMIYLVTVLTLIYRMFYIKNFFIASKLYCSKVK